MTMRVLLILAAISFSAAALAQSAPPKVGNKPLVHVKTLRRYWTNRARLPWSSSVFGRNARVEQKVRVPG